MSKTSKIARRLIGYSFYIPAGYLVVTETSWSVLGGLILWTIGVEFMRTTKDNYGSIKKV